MRTRTLVWLGLAIGSPALGQEMISNWSAPPYWSPSQVSVEAPSGMRHALAAAAVAAPMPFVSVTPCRLVDTRGNLQTGPFGPPSLGINGQRDIPIQSHPVCTGIPATAGAYSLNLTVTNTGAQPFGFLKAWPAGGAEPNVSTLNYPGPGATLANAAVVSAGTGGAISIRSGNASADVVIDINGYYAPQ